MNKESKIVKVAEYIIDNKATVASCAKHFDCSVSTIKKYINNDGNLKDIDLELYKKVKEVQKEIEEKSHHIGGMISKRNSKHTYSEIKKIVETMIRNSWTIEEASKYYNIPRSTLYENIKKIDDEKLKLSLKMLFDGNRLGNKKRL